jgi:hypothetical protein
VRDARQRVKLGHLGQVKSRAEVIAVGVDDDRARPRIQAAEEPLDAEDGLVAERVALAGPGQRERGDGPG